MKFTYFSSKNSIALLTISSLILLPSCTEWIKEKFGGSKKMVQENMPAQQDIAHMSANDKDVLAWLDGKPLVTVQSLQEKKSEIIESNPQLKQMLALMDEKQFDKELTEGIVKQKVVDKYVADNKIDENADYIKEYNKINKSIKEMLNAKFFAEKLDVQVSDSEAQDFYEKNKNELPEFTEKQGGVKASGVIFNTHDAADKFAAKVRSNKNDLQKTVESEKISNLVEDFQLVNEKSMNLPAELRTKIVNMKTPSTEVVKTDDKTFYVVTATHKEEKQYRPFDSQLKEAIKKHLEGDKRNKALDEKINHLKTEYKVTFTSTSKETPLESHEHADEQEKEQLKELEAEQLDEINS